MGQGSKYHDYKTVLFISEYRDRVDHGIQHRFCLHKEIDR